MKLFSQSLIELSCIVTTVKGIQTIFTVEAVVPLKQILSILGLGTIDVLVLCTLSILSQQCYQHRNYFASYSIWNCSTLLQYKVFEMITRDVSSKMCSLNSSSIYWTIIFNYDSLVIPLSYILTKSRALDRSTYYSILDHFV